jgi:hypothetical protein
MAYHSVSGSYITFSQVCLAGSSLGRFLVGLDIYSTLSQYPRTTSLTSRLDTIFLGLLSLITACSFVSRTSIYPTTM